MSEDQGFGILVNRSAYATWVADSVVSEVYGGRGRLTVGQLVKKHALSTSMIMYYLSQFDAFIWSGIMPLRANRTGAPAKGIACLHSGKIVGGSRARPGIVWECGSIWWGANLQYNGRCRIAGKLPQAVNEPIPGENAYITTQEVEKPWHPSLAV